MLPVHKISTWQSPGVDSCCAGQAGMWSSNSAWPADEDACSRSSFPECRHSWIEGGGDWDHPGWFPGASNSWDVRSRRCTC